MTTDLYSLTAAEAAASIAKGEITSEALVGACLDRIAALEPQVQAWAFLDRERALEQAKAADDARRSGKGIGPLHGVPVGIKDIIDTGDMPTENGSPYCKGRQPEKDAACIAALRSAGAVILGKTVTTELATHVPSRTRNPRNLEHTPGGSSAGSAAAVACDMVPLALGTQTKGSVIRPASFCGIYGLKPTFGTIPRTGVLAQALSLDTIGVYGRSIEDVALIADVLNIYDDRDAASFAGSRGRMRATAMEDWSLPPMFAFVKTDAWSKADASTHEAYGELVEQLGGQVHEISIDATCERASNACKIIQDVELSLHFGPIFDRAPDKIATSLGAQIEEGRRVRGVDYLAALEARQACLDTLQEIFLDYGTILTPPARGVAPKGFGSTGDPIFCGLWTYLGVPAVTVPLLEVDGLPLGVQLVGAPRDDARLLRTARSLLRHLEAGT
ncbi:MAG TPA: amidase [Hyphomicrobiaceae bacterium]|nr:amidase [Hyphomicrobiaceae bacterium]